MKKVLVIIGLCMLAGYLIFAAFFFESKPKEKICNHFEVVTDDDAEASLVDVAEIEKSVDKMGLNPYGKPIKEINTYDIQEAILTNKMVKSANVFVTSNGGIRVVIENRKPVLRVISSSGGNYYVDKDGAKVPLSNIFTADLPLATGAVKDSFASGDLLQFALFLIDNSFWNSQIDQIVVLPNEEVKLIPRVGNQEIILGKLDNYREKLDKLKTFYKEALSETGWNRYSQISLKYDKQVVCTKR